jgi:hypothetical protein
LSAGNPFARSAKSTRPAHHKPPSKYKAISSTNALITPDVALDVLAQSIYYSNTQVINFDNFLNFLFEKSIDLYKIVMKAEAGFSGLVN